MRSTRKAQHAPGDRDRRRPTQHRRVAVRRLGAQRRPDRASLDADCVECVPDRGRGSRDRAAPRSRASRTVGPTAGPGHPSTRAGRTRRGSAPQSRAVARRDLRAVRSARPRSRPRHSTAGSCTRPRRARSPNREPSLANRDAAHAGKVLPVARDDHSTTAGADQLVEVEGVDAEIADRPGRAARQWTLRPRRTQRLGGVLDHADAVVRCRLQDRCEPRRMAEQVHRDDRRRLSLAGGRPAVELADDDVRDRGSSCRLHCRPA